jgi:hypothetical protein
MAKAGARLGLPGKLLSLDATVIDLCAAAFDWAKFRTTKGAVKLHLLLDHDGYLPCYAVITEGGVHEIQVARKLQLQRGTMLVFDRGYTDYEWFRRLTEEEVNFVTRLKENAAYLVLERRRLVGDGVRADEIIAMEKQAQAARAPREISPSAQNKWERDSFNSQAGGGQLLGEQPRSLWPGPARVPGCRGVLRGNTYASAVGRASWLLARERPKMICNGGPFADTKSV